MKIAEFAHSIHSDEAAHNYSLFNFLYAFFGPWNFHKDFYSFNPIALRTAKTLLYGVLAVLSAAGFRKEFSPRRAKSFCQDLTSVEKGGNHETSPVNVPNHL